MDRLSRRRMLVVGGGALGALGAAAMAPSAWAWAPSGSVAGAGAGVDPRWVWDEEADPLLASIIERGDVPRVNELLRTWTRNDQPLPAGLPADLREFMEQARRLPAWADQRKLDAAAELQKNRGLFINAAYAGTGFMSFAILREVRAVYYSKGGADVKDRGAKTAKFGKDIADLNAYQPDGTMIVTAVKTRLVHAAVRHLLPQSPHWVQTGSGQIPISQHEILVTWHSLATFVMRKLREWKLSLTSAESAAYLHVWQVTAHMLGVRDEYIPVSWETAYTQSAQILDPAMGPSREGVDLLDDLLTTVSQQTSPGGIDRPLMHAFARYMVGDRVAGWLAIPREPIWDPLIRTGFPALVAFHERLIPLPLVPQIAWTIQEALKQLALLFLGEGKKIHLDIPEINRPS